MDSLTEEIIYPVEAQWDFKKADLLAVKPNGFLNGKCFFAYNIPGLQFHLRICPKFNDCKHSLFYLYVNGSPQRNVSANCKISIESSKLTFDLKVVYNRYTGYGYALSYATFFDKLFINGIFTIKIEGNFMVKKDSISNIISFPVSMNWKIKEKDIKLLPYIKLRSKRFRTFDDTKYSLVFETKKGQQSFVYLQLEFEQNASINAVMEFSTKNGPRYTKEHVFEGSQSFGIPLASPLSIVDGLLTVEFNAVFIKQFCSFPVLKKIKGLGTKREQKRKNKKFVIYTGATKICVNKNILIKASPVWKRMFDVKWKESIENEMTITDFSSKVVKSAIDICNNGRTPCKFDTEDLISFYKFGHKYEINLIMNFAQKNLLKNLSAATVCQLINFSKSFYCTKLYQRCLEFLRNCSKKRFAVLGLETLDKDFVCELFFNLFTSEVKTDSCS